MNHNLLNLIESYQYISRCWDEELLKCTINIYNCVDLGPYYRNKDIVDIITIMDTVWGFGTSSLYMIELWEKLQNEYKQLHN